MRQRPNHTLQGMLFLAVCVMIAGALFFVIKGGRSGTPPSVHADLPTNLQIIQVPLPSAPTSDAGTPPGTQVTTSYEADGTPVTEYEGDEPAGQPNMPPSMPQQRQQPQTTSSPALAPAPSAAAPPAAPSDEDQFAPH